MWGSPEARVDNGYSVRSTKKKNTTTETDGNPLGTRLQRHGVSLIFAQNKTFLRHR